MTLKARYRRLPLFATTIKKMSISSADAALAFAPPWWSAAAEGRARKWIWDGLKMDSPGQVWKAIRMNTFECTKEGGGWPLDKFLIRMRLGLWPGSKGKGTMGRRRATTVAFMLQL